MGFRLFFSTSIYRTRKSLIKSTSVLLKLVKSSLENSVDPDQLASKRSQPNWVYTVFFAVSESSAIWLKNRHQGSVYEVSYVRWKMIMFDDVLHAVSDELLACNLHPKHFLYSLYLQEEQKAILQAEKIRIALEKIKEAKIKKVS